MLIQIGVKIYDDKYFIWNTFVSAFFLLFNSNQTTQKYLNNEAKSQKLQLNSEDMMSM